MKSKQENFGSSYNELPRKPDNEHLLIKARMDSLLNFIYEHMATKTDWKEIVSEIATKKDVVQILKAIPDPIE